MCFLLVVVLNFFLPRLLPGNPVAYLTGFSEQDMTPAQVAFYEDALHLNKPLAMQFGYYLRSLLTRSESYTVIREVDYIKAPKETGYRSLHLIVNVPIVISEGTMVLPVEIQLRTIAMDMWASLEHELRYKSDRQFTEQDAARLRLCSDAISEIDREMQDIYQGNEPQYHA